MTTQNRLKFCEQIVLVDMQLARQDILSSKKHYWSQAPSKDFLNKGWEETVILLLWLKFFHGLLHHGCTFHSQSLIRF